MKARNKGRVAENVPTSEKMGRKLRSNSAAQNEPEFVLALIDTALFPPEFDAIARNACIESKITGEQMSRKLRRMVLTSAQVPATDTGMGRRE